MGATWQTNDGVMRHNAIGTMIASVPAAVDLAEVAHTDAIHTTRIGGQNLTIRGATGTDQAMATNLLAVRTNSPASAIDSATAGAISASGIGMTTAATTGLAAIGTGMA